MRRTLIIAGSFLGLAIVILGGLLGWAVLNLNSIIQSRRDYILSRISDAAGRPVTVKTIKASLGWGVMIDLNTVQVAGDPRFSPLPLLQAHDIYLKVEFIPLLFHKARITELNITQPVLHLIRNRDGDLNLATLARHRAHHAEQLSKPGQAARANQAPFTLPNSNSLALAPSFNPNSVAAISIHKFTLTDGEIDYLDQSVPAATPVQFQDLQVTVANFSFASRFEVDLSMAAFGDQKNFVLEGNIGPIITAAGLDLNAIPLSFTASAGPLTLAQLRSIPALAHLFPPPITIKGPLNATATAAGTVDAIKFTANSSLTSNEVAWQPSFTKPAGLAMVLAATGTHQASELTLDSFNLRLASLNAALTHVAIAPHQLKASLSTNGFSIAQLAGLVPAVAKYRPSGTATLHGAVAIAAHQRPIFNGAAILSGAALSIPEARGGAAQITQLNGTIRLNGNTARIGPLAFNLGSAHARLEAEAQSLEPPRLNFKFSADKLILADLIPSRQNNSQDHGPEYLQDLTATGTADFNSLSPAAGTGPAKPASASVNLTTAAGLVDNLPFTNLALATVYSGDRVTINSLTLNSCDGAISANGAATLGEVPGFDLNLSTSGLNLQKALTAVKAKAANTIRGTLTGNVQISGRGTDFARVRPTLRGHGKAQVTGAKLVGVNVAAQALRKIDNLPAIGVLVPGSVIANHPELFKSPDTDIQSASLTFVINGARLSTNDFFAQAIDYSATASGWFDLDKDLSMNSQIFLSRPFSNELIAARKNIVFLTDRSGQVVIPLRITGRLPHPQVLPNIDILAQRAASHAVQNKLGSLIDKGGKGLGGLFKHGNPLHGLFQ
ncbi:MAG TPA: AsmA-like C-terminal region-containing protein [Candidatus Binataceae bacterium]|nr:AsmA-like C-terminal region-containing protein [Candidatus Binataceae bacterium]